MALEERGLLRLERKKELFGRVWIIWTMIFLNRKWAYGNGSL